MNLFLQAFFFSVKSTDTLLFTGLSGSYLKIVRLGERLRTFRSVDFSFLGWHTWLPFRPNCYSSLFFSMISFFSLKSSPLVSLVSLFMNMSERDLAVIVLNFLYFIRFMSLYSWLFTMLFIFLDRTYSFSECSFNIFFKASGLCSSVP